MMVTPLYADIRARGVARERPFLAQTLRALSDKSLIIPPTEALDLTAVVESAVHSTGPV
jgi:hypothetical protein